MNTIGFRQNVQKSFFRGAMVMRVADRATAKVLGHAGGIVRKIARNSMKPGKGATAPAGSPPFTHAGNLKNLLFYALRPNKKSVVIGPIKTRLASKNGEQFKGTLPQLIERGGPVDLLEQQYRPGGQWYRVGRDGPKPGATATKLVHTNYHPHPYMAPALRIVQPQLPSLWADSMKPHG